MKKLTFIFLFFISFSAFAFDYHGIKSGMHWDEVKALTKCGGDYSNDCKTYSYVVDFFGGIGNEPPHLVKIFFDHTSDERLWKITLVFEKSGGTKAAAHLIALRELYKDSVSIEGEYIYVSLIDNDLFEEDVNEIYLETIDKY